MTHAADSFVRKEIISRELPIVEKTVSVKKERIAAPTKEKAAVTGCSC